MSVKELKEFVNDKWTKNKRALVFDHLGSLKLIEKGPVLDLAAGNGLVLLELKKRGINGIGLEISDVAIAQAKNISLDIRQFDVSRPLPFKDNSFAGVLMIAILEHLYSPQKVLKEAWRVSQDYIIVCVPNFNSFPARLQVLCGKAPENNKAGKDHTYWFNPKILYSMIERTGFEVEKLEVNSFFSRVPILKNIMLYLAHKFPSIFALVLIVRAKKII